MIPNGQNSINPSNYFEKLPKRALKTPAFKARFLIFVVTDIGQSNKTELNNSRRIIWGELPKTGGKKTPRSDKAEFLIFLVAVIGQSKKQNQEKSVGASNPKRVRAR